MSYEKGTFYNFLSGFRVDRGAEFTHTSLCKPTGSFYISSEVIDQFYSTYETALQHKEDLHIIEKHRDIGPIVIDLDFRFDKSATTRQYDFSLIQTVVNIYIRHIVNFIDIKGEKVNVYVMEKPSPVKDLKNNEVIKDGIHIMIPDIVTKPVVQHLIRKAVIPELKTAFKDLKLKNTVEDIVDEAVIEKNGWLMYGSKKPQTEPYKLTYVMRYRKQEDSWEYIGNSSKLLTSSGLVKKLSIRNKYESTPTKQEKVQEVKAFEQSKKPKTLPKNPAFQTTQNIKKNACDNIEIVEKLIDILSPARADNYQEWIRVGWCLRTIDHRLLPKWVNFSMKSSKFEDGECERMWNYMKDDGLGIGTLHMWAKMDDPEQYREILKNDLMQLICKSTNETHNDIARVVHYLYKYTYVCVSIKNNMWYEFRNHRWISCDSGHSLRSRISDEVVREYGRQVAYYNDKAMNESDDSDQRRYLDIVKKLNNIQLKLKQTSFKDNIMKECRELFYVEKFEEKLDSRCNLLGFENGIYDLDSEEFRDGRPEDYVSFSTGINYIPYEDDNEYVQGLKEFIAKIFPKESVRKYVITSLASFLHGNISREIFHLWTGSGCHAIDTDIMMFDGTLKKVQDVKVGDQLMGDDSTARNVLRLCRGFSDMYKIVPSKGESFVVNGDHVLSLKATQTIYMYDRKKAWEVRWTQYDDDFIMSNLSKSFSKKEDGEAYMEMLYQNPEVIKKGEVIDVKVCDYLKLLEKIGPKKFYLYKNGVEYQNGSENLPIDPWFLGYWLGNGHSNCAAVTTMFDEVVEKIHELYDNDYDVHFTQPKGRGATWSICKKGNNCMYRLLTQHNLKDNKHIPNDYLFNNREVRLNLLAGIIDSDGHYQEKSNHYEITFKNEQLMDNTITLARSLGFSCYKYDKKATWTHNGVKKERMYFRIHIVGDIDEIPCIVEKKKAKVNEKKRDNMVTSFDVEKVEDADFYGFELDNNHRYLMGDFTVTHNSNGKSKLTDLFERSFGDYAVKFPITLLTQKRAASNAATSELARAKGKRFASLQEPSEDEKLNIGLMKELSGGDKIMARCIYKEPIEFKPQFKMILACNHLPAIPSDDGGTWRRIRVAEFTSKFCERPDPNKPNEFAMDTELASKFEDWKEWFMSMLIETFKVYKTQGIHEPEEVLKCTREYQRTNDSFLDFVESELEKTPSGTIDGNDMFSCWKSWVPDNAPFCKGTNKKALLKAVHKILGDQHVSQKGHSYKFIGVSFKSNSSINDDLD